MSRDLELSTQIYWVFTSLAANGERVAPAIATYENHPVMLRQPTIKL